VYRLLSGVFADSLRGALVGKKGLQAACLKGADSPLKRFSPEIKLKPKLGENNGAMRQPASVQGGSVFLSSGDD
jgi:hypothetical protein